MEPIRVLILDDHALFRFGLVRLLENQPGIRVAAHCGTPDEALAGIRAAGVDIVLLDWDLGAQNGLEFLRKARATGFEGRVLMVTAGINDREALELVAEGTAGVLLKSQPPERLVSAIRKVMEGQTPAECGRSPLPDRRGIVRKPPGFTERERMVLRGVVDGLGNKQLADRLQISEASVKAALQQLFAKTGVRTRAQLVRAVFERHRDVLAEVEPLPA
jgi:two-component system nitrate/nitrite response regulator NarL